MTRASLLLPRRAAILFIAAMAALVPAVARGDVRIFLPVDMSYSTERYVTVMALTKDEPWMKDRDTANVTVNDREKYRFKVKSGYYATGEVYLEDGANTIAVESKSVTVFFGKEKKPPPGYGIPYGHLSADDTCDECHTMKEDGGAATLVLSESADTLCRWCHFQPGVLRKMGPAASIHPPVNEGQCLLCHLPHASTRRALLKDDPRKLCAPCHDTFLAGIKAKSFVHGPLNVGTCDICHALHASPQKFLLKAPERDLCLGCHGGTDLFGAGTKAPSTHPGIEDGRCHECHDGHASNNPKMMKKIVNNLCVECHVEKTHNFHEEKGFSIYICGRCHDIHRPDTFKLLTVESRKLCDSCHAKDMGIGEFVHKPVAEKSCFECHGFHLESMDKEQAKVCRRCHPTDASFAAKHPVAMKPGVRCTECHPPHRATTAKLIFPFQHTPFAKRECAKCHDILDRGEAPAEAAGADTLCFNCHPTKKIPTENREGYIIHKPFQRENCRSCHLTHGSQFPALLTTNMFDLCGGCHSFVKKIKSFAPVSIHSSVRDGRCGECHDSHLGTNPFLLKKKPEEICQSCHQAVMAGPGGAPFTVPHAAVAAGSCLKCHTGHYARYPKLLRERETAICQKCHEEFFKTAQRTQKASQHEPYAKGMCGKCHGIHGAEIRKLITLPGNELCRSCHKDLAKGIHHQYEADHETYEAGGDLQGKKVACLECHRPHYSAAKSLLIRKDAPTCRACHTF